MDELITIFSKQGKPFEFTIRFANPNDAEIISTLLKKQHGTNYPKKMLIPDYLSNKIRAGNLRVALAETKDGVLMGIVGADDDSAFKGSLAFIMMLIKPEYRSFGVGQTLASFLLKSTAMAVYTCIYCHCMTVDSISQSNQRRLGYTVTGILLNCSIYDTKAEYIRDMNLTLPFKETLVVVCLPMAKRNVGTLYGHPYSAYISDIYTELGAAYTLAENDSPPDASLSELVWEQDDDQKYCEFFVTLTGLDFVDRIKKMLDQYPDKEQTFNGFINLNDPGCPYASRILEDHGFFFSGLQPLAGQYEYAIMHYSPFLEVPFEKFAVIPDFKKYFDFIWNNYKEQQDGWKD